MFNTHIDSLNILNPDGKTVLRLSLEDLRLVDGHKGHLRRVLKLHPVKGYRKEFTVFDHYIHDMGFEFCHGRWSILDSALKAAGREPQQYSSKIHLELDTGVSCRAAVLAILEELFSIVELNEEGMKKDIDIEFLHDYRVSIRKIRSLLSQVKGVFPDAVTADFKKEFAKWGKLTNKSRDMDVYLFSKNKFMSKVPMDIREGLEPFFKSLKIKRNREYKKLKKLLESAE